VPKCPRCTGNVHRKTDVYSVHDSCLQCGWYDDIEVLAVAAPPLNNYRHQNRSAVGVNWKVLLAKSQRRRPSTGRRRNVSVARQWTPERRTNQAARMAETNRLRLGGTHS
jgi:hypothetical protein